MPLLRDRLISGRIARSLETFRAARRLPPAKPHRAAPDAALLRASQKPLTRLAAEHVFSRVAGAHPVAGNSLRLLIDGPENYRAWLEAIQAARHTIQLENYIIASDATGRRFRDALAAKAREGVTVRVLYDWLGCFLKSRPLFLRSLRRAGAEVRCFNRPRLDSPFGWLSRNHRKSLAVDGTVGFVAGLCIGDVWLGDPARNQPPWRDTGCELRGPALADLHAAFAEAWAYAGGPRLPALPPPPGHPSDPGQGTLSLRVIGSKPNTMGLYRFDQLVAAIARHRLWLTDAYFVGTTSYVQALIEAAEDGVDVRLLVPGSSDIPVAKALSRAGYRPLLEHGVRVFEWNGPMLHAKTAVADGRWARIGSTNLNIASWAGNWELDIAVEDEAFAASMETQFERDLQNATEIVLERRRVHSATPRRLRRGSPGRLAAGAAGFGSAVGAAITNRRPLGPAEARVAGTAGALLLALAILTLLFPRLVAIPIGLLAAWIAITLLLRAFHLHRGAEPPDG